MELKDLVPFSKKSESAKDCEHYVIFQAVCEEVFEKFKANHKYIVESDAQFIDVTSKCNLCRKDIPFHYNLERRILEPMLDTTKDPPLNAAGADVADMTKRLTYHDCDIPIKCKFVVKYDTLAESLDEKTLFLIRIHNLFDNDTTHLHITKNYSVNDNSITMLEGEVSNIIPVMVDYTIFKTLYRKFTKEFNNDFKVIIER